MAKAKIQKLKEDLLLGNGSNKTIFPATVGDAVFVKNKQQYEKLPNLLDRKWERVLTKTTVDVNATEEESYSYYIIGFNTKNVDVINTFNNYINCSHDTFSQLINESGIEEDITRLNTIDTTLDINTTPVFETRMQFNAVKALYLQYLKLHSYIVPKPEVVPQDGGDEIDENVVEYTKYPARFKININQETASAIARVLNNIALSYKNTTVYFDIILEALDNDADSMMFTRYDYNNTTYRAKSSFIMSIISDYYQNPEYDDLPFVDVAQAISCFLSNYSKIYFLAIPSNYPRVTSSSALTQYENEKVRSGRVLIKPELKYIDNSGHLNTVELSDIFPPKIVKIIFNPNREFHFVTPEDDTTIELNSKNGFIGDINLSVINMESDDTVVVRLDDSSQFGVQDSLDGDINTSSSSITYSQNDLVNGKIVKVFPSNYENKEGFLPYDDAHEETCNLIFEHISDNEVVHSITMHLRCVVKPTDIPEEDIIDPVDEVVCSTIDPSSDTNRVGYFNIIFNKLETDVSFGGPTATHFPNTDPMMLMIIPTDLSGVTVYYSVEKDDNQEFINYHSLGRDPIERDAIIQNNNELSVKFIIPTSVGQTRVGNHGTVSITMECNEKSYILTSQFSFEDQNPSVISDQDDWDDINGDRIVLSAKDPDESKIIRALTNGSQISVLTVRDLWNITSLPNYLFSRADYIVDASFFKYMRNLTEIPEGLFFECTSLKTIVFPNSVTEVGYRAFESCVSLENVDLGTGMSGLRYRIFAGCTSLLSLTMRYIGEYEGNPVGVGCNARMLAFPALSEDFRLYVPAELYTWYTETNSFWSQWSSVIETIVED